MNSGFELPIRFTYREPRWLPFYHIALHLGALLSIIATGLPLIVRVLLIMYVISSLVIWLYKRCCNKSNNHRLTINLSVKDEWTLSEKEFETTTAILVSARILYENLVFIKLTSITGKNYDLWLSRACIDENNLRRLRVRLRLPVTP